VSKGKYIDILCRLGDAVKRKRPEKWRTAFGFIFTTMLQHTGRFSSRISQTNNNVTTMEHPPYSSDLATADFYLFPRNKSALKGRRFCVVTDIIRNATEELKRLLQNVFQELLQHLYSR
jgi:hypothetical protein